MVIKPIKAVAIVKKKNPRLNLLDLFDTRDVPELKVDKETEYLVQIEIRVIKQLTN